VCVDANAGLRAQQRQKAREKDAIFAQKRLQFYNKETSLARAQQRNIMGYGRDVSDAYVKALYQQGKGRQAVQGAAAKYFASKALGKSKEAGRSRTAGRNAYLNYLRTVGKVDSVMDATFGRNMAYAQTGARRIFLNKNARAREALGIPAAYGAPVMLSAPDRLTGALSIASQVASIASMPMGGDATLLTKIMGL